MKKFKYNIGTVLRHKSKRTRFVIDNIELDGLGSGETFMVRRLMGGAAYGPAQPKTSEQLDRLYLKLDGAAS